MEQRSEQFTGIVLSGTRAGGEHRKLDEARHSKRAKMNDFEATRGGVWVTRDSAVVLSNLTRDLRDARHRLR